MRPSPLSALRLYLLRCVVALAGPALSPLAASAQPADVLTCTGPFARDADEARLIKAFGAANVQRGRIEVGEGEKQAGAVLFPKDRKRRLQLTWQDGGKRRRPGTIYIREGSAWSVAAPGGGRIAPGATLLEVEAANGGPFTILGFGWDYGGTATDWRGGRLAGAGGGCSLIIRFNQTPEAGSDSPDDVSGDREFSSSDAAIRAVKPFVGEILLSWPD